jgi:hypothetical protein
MRRLWENIHGRSESSPGGFSEKANRKTIRRRNLMSEGKKCMGDTLKEKGWAAKVAG